MRTRCARIDNGDYFKASFSGCHDVTYPGIFNNNMDSVLGDTLSNGNVDVDPNSDCSNTDSCTVLQVCVWTAAAGYTADTFSTAASGGAGCDGPEWMVGRSEQNFNEDGDGLGMVKSTAAGPAYGSNQVSAFGGSGNLGACSAGEEAINGTNPDAPRDFFDVNNSGNVNAADTGQVRSGSLSTAGDASGKYKRTLDLNPASADSGRGDGKVNAADIGLVRSQFNKSCLAAP
jgi:hypothetical protein